MSKQARNRLLLAAALSGIASAAHAQGYSIDWYGDGGGGGSTQAQMTAGETAGFVPLANWNSFTPNLQAAPQTLMNSAGTPTSTSVTWTSQNTWNTNITQADGDLRMMKGYLDTNDTSITNVTVSGLPIAIEPWAVIVYYDGDTGENRVGRYSLSGALSGNATFWGRNEANNRFNGTFVLAQTPIDPLTGGGNIDSNPTAALTVPSGNFMIFPGVTGDGFVLEAQASVSAGGTNRAPLNGIQIVPMSQVPEPGALMFIGVAAAGLMARRRKA